MKAYILKFHPEKKIYEDDGATLAFEKCVSYVTRSIGKEFVLIEESLNNLYEYRCNIIHYYGESIELILYSLLRPNVLYFADFIKKYFEIDLANETNLIILPIGFNRAITPVDFLSKKTISGNDYVKRFIASIIKSLDRLAKEGVEDGLVCNYGMFLEKENNPKHTDLLVAFTKDPTEADLTLTKVTTIGGYTNEKNAPKVQIDEISLFREVFIFTYHDIRKRAAVEIKNFSANQFFLDCIKQIKNDQSCYRFRPIFVNKPDNNNRGQGFYSEAAYTKLKEIYRT